MKVSASDKKLTEKEYKILFTTFQRFLDTYENSQESFEVMEDIITLRAGFLIDRVISNLRLDFDKALGLLKNHNDFTTEYERQQRNILIAAINNLVDFAVAEEYRMTEDFPESYSGDKERGLFNEVFEKYNLNYATQENQDVSYAAGMAAWWLTIPSDSIVTFMTQADERVRPWHLSHEGLSFTKGNFPPDLIPPIEWGCRCFLITDGFSSVIGSLYTHREKVNTNPIFRESLATCGRIFSDEHPYFKQEIPGSYKAIGDKIKQKLYAL